MESNTFPAVGNDENCFAIVSKKSSDCIYLVVDLLTVSHLAIFTDPDLVQSGSMTSAAQDTNHHFSCVLAEGGEFTTAHTAKTSR
jgi:hypothetical protein